MNISILLRHKSYCDQNLSTSVYHIYEHIIINRINKILYSRDIVFFELMGFTQRDKTYIDIHTKEQKEYQLILKYINNSIYIENIEEYEIFNAIEEIENELRFILSVNNIPLEKINMAIIYLNKNVKAIKNMCAVYKNMSIIEKHSYCIQYITSKEIVHHNLIEDSIRKLLEDKGYNRCAWEKWCELIRHKFFGNNRYVMVGISIEKSKIKNTRKIYEFRCLLNCKIKSKIIFSQIVYSCQEDTYNIVILNRIDFLDEIVNDIKLLSLELRHGIFLLDDCKFKMKLIL